MILEATLFCSSLHASQCDWQSGNGLFLPPLVFFLYKTPQTPNASHHQFNLIFIVSVHSNLSRCVSPLLLLLNLPLSLLIFHFIGFYHLSAIQYFGFYASEKSVRFLILPQLVYGSANLNPVIVVLRCSLLPFKPDKEILWTFLTFQALNFKFLCVWCFIFSFVFGDRDFDLELSPKFVQLF